MFGDYMRNCHNSDAFQPGDDNILFHQRRWIGSHHGGSEYDLPDYIWQVLPGLIPGNEGRAGKEGPLMGFFFLFSLYFYFLK